MKRFLFIRLLLLLVVTSLSFQVRGQKLPHHFVDSLLAILPNPKPDEVQLKILIRLIHEYNDVDGREGLKYERPALDLANKLNSEWYEGIIRNEVGRIYWRGGNYDSARLYHNAARQIFESLHDDEQLAITLRNIGQDYLNDRNHETSLEYFEQSLKMFEEMDDAFNLGYVYNLISYAYAEQGDYLESSRYAYQGLKIYEKINDKNGVANMFSVMAENALNMGNYQEALKNFKMGVDEFVADGDLINAAVNWNLMGITYRLLGNYEEASRNHAAAFEIGKKTNNLTVLAKSWDGFADIKKAQGDYAGAIQDYLRSADLFEQWSGKHELAQLYKKMSETFRQMKVYDSARVYLNKAYAIMQVLNNKKLFVEFYHEAELLDSATRNWEGAYANQKSYTLYHDSVFGQQTIQEITALQKQYEFDKQQAAIEAEQRLRYIVLGGIIILLAAFVTVVFMALRNQRIANQRITEQKEELEAIADALKSANEELAKVSQFKEGLTYMIAHDMKNALNTILGFSESDEQGERMLSITKAGNLMMNMVTNMLDVQRFEEAKIKLNIKEYDLSDLIEEARVQVLLILRMKSIRLDNEIHSLKLKVDKDIFVRVLMNLLTNAVKYSKVGGAVKIKTNFANGPLLISVQDDGKGISAEKLPHVFDRFWQGDPEQIGKAASTGLGLTFCKLAMEAHGGSISAHSAINKGTIIQLTFPTDSFSVRQETNGMAPYNSIEIQFILEAEYPQLKEIVKELKGIEVFQVGKLTALFKAFQFNKLKSIWATDLVAAVHQGDEEKYNQLLSFITQNKN